MPDKQEEIDQLYRDVLGSEAGQKLLDHLADQHQLLKVPYCDEPNRMYFEMGRKSVVLDIIERVHGSVERKRLQEHAYDGRFDQARRRSGR